ncbi:hypothetical protein FSP39_000905 [Pinctada imbricata]|uniref:Proteasome maturation protein n=1 Tax=Pinctada imbricata TaxID=66713 RepID=A0AA89BWM2_PINIB|nr:hypothetical protein FSP39_000905 [Pinctada imbricata]
MQYGLHSSRESTSAVHPLEHSEKHWNENKCQMDFAMLRKMEGIHMPLRLQMENNISQKMCRLPGMVSSNVMRDTLTGRDEMIDFEDVLNNPFEAEEVGNIHMLMEKRQGLL